MKRQNDGKITEALMKYVFKTIAQDCRFDWHRMTDSYAAGNMVASQPCDFLIETDNGIFYLEVKSSRTTSRFVPSMLTPSQSRASYMQRWFNRPYWIVFHDMRRNQFDVLRSSDAGFEVVKSCPEGSLVTTLKEVLEVKEIDDEEDFEGLESQRIA